MRIDIRDNEQKITEITYGDKNHDKIKVDTNYIDLCSDYVDNNTIDNFIKALQKAREILRGRLI